MPKEDTVCFQSSGYRLHGIVHEAVGTARTTGLVLLNGWGGYRIGPHRMYVKAARAFAASGFPVLRFDFRGTGESDGTLAGNTAEDVRAFADDTHAAIDFFRQRCAVERVYLLGLCTGGEIAVLYASGVGAVQGLILWSTASHFELFQAEEPMRRLRHYSLVYLRKLTLGSTWRKIIRRGFHVRGVVRTLFADFRGIRRPAQQPTESVGQPNLFSSLRGPVLLVYGTADPPAKPSYSFFETSLQSRRIPYNLHLIEGADASFSSLPFVAEACTSTLSWLTMQA